MPGNKAPDYVPIEQARKLPGLRVAFTQGVPGPWGVAARAMLDFKGLDYIAVPQVPGGANEELKAWTGQTSAPVFMYNEDRIRALWSEKIVLLDQLRPEPRLIPADEDRRIEMFGLCHEICGDDGLGWSLRLLMMSAQRKAQDTEYSGIQSKYSSPVEDAHPRARINRIVDALGRRLEAQAKSGSRYFVGDAVSAVDFYWAAFSNVFVPMSAELCEMPAFYVDLCAAVPSHLDKTPAPILFEHRDHVVRSYFRTPIAF